MTYKRIRNDDFMLICNYGSCSFTEHFDNTSEPFEKGWRMDKDGHICPLCMDKRNENVMKVREERVKRGWSSIELSRRTGVSLAKIQQVETGYRTEQTSLEIKRKIADALNLHVLDVFPDIKEQLMKCGILAVKST